MTHPRLEIALSRAALETRLPSRRTARLLGMANLGCGGLIILLLLTFLGVIVVRGALPEQATVIEAVFGTVFLAVIAGLMLWLGTTSLRRIRRANAIDPDGTAPFVMPGYAFAIDSDRLVFPTSADRDTETWPLDETTASVTRALGADALRLESPGRTPRQFAQRALELSPRHIVQLIDERRGGSPAAH